MRKQGVRSKKFEDVDNKILEILKQPKTTLEVKKELNDQGIDIDWRTVKKYLYELANNNLIRSPQRFWLKI